MTNTAITRVISLDVFRGITIAIMILVNSPGNSFAYRFLEHSAWNGCTLADLVFPFFIVIVGMSSVLALTNLKIKGFTNQDLFKIIVKRSVYLFCIGLLLNLLPNHFDLSHIRILGVLQRIAFCYFCASALFLITNIRTQIGLIAALLIGYCFLMNGFSTINTLSINHNLVGYFDRLILSSRHLYTPMFDPEGLLSTIPAIASALLGNVLGSVLVSSHSKQQQFYWMVCAGLMLSAAGLIWDSTFPINKSLWSSSYVLWTSGLSFLVFSLCFRLIDVQQIINWSKPFSLLGKNAMLVYMLHVIFLKLQAIIFVHNSSGEWVNLRLYITDLLFSPFSAKNASLSYALGYTLFWLLILKGIALWRQKNQ